MISTWGKQTSSRMKQIHRTTVPLDKPPPLMPRAHLPVIDGLIDEMQAQEIIEPSQSEWASNIVLVQQKR